MKKDTEKKKEKPKPIELRDLKAKKNPKGGTGTIVPPRGPAPPGG